MIKKRDIIIVLILLGALFGVATLDGCAGNQEWKQHDSLYLDWNHAAFSIYGHKEFEQYINAEIKPRLQKYDTQLEAGLITQAEYDFLLKDLNDLMKLKLLQIRVLIQSEKGGWWGEPVKVK